jgi:hypothetical protein
VARRAVTVAQVIIAAALISKVSPAVAVEAVASSAVPAAVAVLQEL